MLDNTPQRKYPDGVDDNDDERPALKKTHSSSFCEEESTPSSSFMMRQQSLFEKVQLWQKQNEHNLTAPPQIDKDGFVMPTPMIRRNKVKDTFIFKTPMVRIKYIATNFEYFIGEKQIYSLVTLVHTPN